MAHRPHTCSLGAALALGGLLAAGASAQPFCQPYTLCTDFSQGTLNSLQCIDDALSLSSQTTSLPVMWIANAGEDSVSKWDTTLNREIGRYGTWFFAARPAHDAFTGPAPSRTAVDLDGNVYVANRHFDGKPASVMKILNSGFIDRNGNAVMDTCADANNNGLIDPAEQIYHTDTNNNGVLEDSEIRDERIAWIRQVGPGNGLGRCLAIDAGGDIWVGLYNSFLFHKLDGATGAQLSPAAGYASGARPYGAFVDRDGILWAATLGGTLIKFNTNVGLEGLMALIGSPSNYGVTGLRRNPDNLGERTFVIVGGSTGYRVYDTLLGGPFTDPSAVKVFSYAPGLDSAGNIQAGASNSTAHLKYDTLSGVVIWNSAANPVATRPTIAANRATIVDSDGNGWRIDVDNHRMQKVDGTNGHVIPTALFGAIVPTGRHPYTYSDATGSTLLTSFPQGFWTGTYDSGCVDTRWGTISWNESVPVGTSITVRARSSNDQLAWSPYETATNGGTLTTTPNGRYLQWEVRLQVLAGNISPILYDLTICGERPGIAIDINPNRVPNPVYLSRNYTIYVACLGSADTDVTLLDWTTARFGPTGAEASAVRAPTYRDLNNDGFVDALYGFRTFDCGFALGQTTGTFTIDSPGGCDMAATDSVVVNP